MLAENLGLFMVSQKNLGENHVQLFDWPQTLFSGCKREGHLTLEVTNNLFFLFLHASIFIYLDFIIFAKKNRKNMHF